MADPQLDPAEVRVSCGGGVTLKDQKEKTLSAVYNAVLSPQTGLLAKIEHLRRLVDNGELKEYKKQKRSLPSICLSGRFKKREDKSPPTSEDLIQHSGRLQIDIDQLEQPRVESEAVRDKIGQDPHIEITHLSPSGRGVKGALLIPVCKDDQEHKRAFTAAQAYIKATYGLDIDKQCSDVRRLFFASYDPDAKINKNAKVLDIEQWLPAEQKTSQAAQDWLNSAVVEPKEVIIDAGGYAKKDSKLDPKECARKYAQKVLEKAVSDIETAPDTKKHSTRLERSRLVGGFAAAGHLDEADAWAALRDAALKNTTNAAQAIKDVTDGFEHGKQSKIDPPPIEEKASSDLVVKIAKKLPPPTPTGNTTATENDDWADPEPLIVKTDPTPYPIESLPPIIKDAVLEVAEFVQAPVPIVASSALAAIATVAQGHFDVRRAEGLEGPISLFCLAIADSGDRKTSAARFSKTIQQHEKNERERLAPEWKKYQGLVDSWESKRRGLKQRLTNQQQKGEENEAKDTEEELVALQEQHPEPPHMPRWQYQDFTIEALGKGLMGWPAAVIESDESGSVFGGYSMREAAMKVLADLNRLWDGKPIHVDRRQSESYLIDGVRLSVSLMIQEPALREFFRQSKQLARGTGFLARFLISWPSSMIGQRFYKDPPKGWPALSAFHQRMEHLLSKPLQIDRTGSLELQMLELDDQARNRWIQFHDDLEQELGAGKNLHDVRDIASKTADNAVRIAANFHAFTSFGQSNRITGSMMSAGGNLALWHLYESQRFFNELAVSPEEANAITLDAWMIDRCRSKGSNEIPRRELQREGPVRRPRDLEQALLFLSSLFRCRAVKDGKKVIIQINPALLEGNDGTK